MNREELTVSLGVDNSKLTRGLETASEKVHHWVGEIGSHLAASFGIGAVIGGIERGLEGAMANAQTIKRISEGTGASTAMVQNMINLGKATGIADGQIERMLDTFAKNLKPGSDPDKALDEFADKLAGIEDPATRAQLAVEAFGKGGIKLIPILKDGASGLHKMSEEFGILTDSELEEIERAEHFMKKTEANLNLFFSRVFSGAKYALDVIKDRLSHPFDLNRDSPAEVARAAATAELDEFLTLKEEKEKISKDAADEAAEYENEVAERMMRRRLYEAQQLADKEKKIAEKLQDEKDAIADRASDKKRVKLKGVLDTGKYNPDIERLRILEEDARQSKFFGNKERLNADTIEANALRARLVSGLSRDIATKQNPQDKVVAELLQILAPISDKGMAVRIVNAD